MRQYTTPTLPLMAEGVDITGADHIWVTFSDKSRNQTITKDRSDFNEIVYDGTDTNISVTLTQEETGSFIVNAKVDVEINWMRGNKRYATEIKTVNVKENLLKKVMPQVVEPEVEPEEEVEPNE